MQYRRDYNWDTGYWDTSIRFHELPIEKNVKIAGGHFNYLGGFFYAGAAEEVNGMASFTGKLTAVFNSEVSHMYNCQDDFEGSYQSYLPDFDYFSPTSIPFLAKYLKNISVSTY